MSSSPIRLMTKAKPSRASKIPAMAPTMVERERRRASRIVMRTRSDPKTTELNRHPKELNPNNCSPVAMSHLPTGGWTTNSASGVQVFVIPRTISALALAASGQVASYP